MVAQIISFPEQKSSNKLAVSFRFLLSLYAIVPLCLLVLWLDSFGLDHAIRDMLPSSPSHFLLFQILFGTPHIIASNLLLLSHDEYLNAFKRKLMAMTLFIMVFFGIGSLFIPYRGLYIITACWTVYHVLKQQHGIAKAVCRLPNWAFYLQLWVSVSAGIFIYMGIFLKNSLEPGQAALVLEIASVLTAGLMISTLVCLRYVPSRFGLYFLWANTLLVVSSWYVYSQQYYFLAILMPRLVHDITAYSFYVTHDVNRHGEQAQNNLFKAAAAVRLPIWLVLPLLSFVLTYLLQAYGDDLVNLLLQTLFSTQIYKAVTLGLLGYLALMHYYTEAFVWASGSPLRRYIRFSGI
ncbi:hypothetical protein [Methylomonas albis]|uniref:Uncharacterized protein n=1 Tax=Methylomonas albis TaxID=1854563 RepID=A0ABR9CY42_9GAMM|nr:hypothetical protein [Methylomonas albis]MBD9355650.1 hypothetical protein [Methylomonas albis]CAD6878664.1 hypothetical protein [Methylomonas albis]